MTEIQIRLANPDDAEGMAAVLNPIIAAGGTTAHETPVTSDDMVEIIASAICCHVALDDAGEIAGMAWGAHCSAPPALQPVRKVSPSSTP